MMQTIMSTAAKFSDFHHVLVMPVIAEEKIVAPKPTMVDRIPIRASASLPFLKQSTISDAESG
mgnify:CR=1 FL=1